MYKASLIFILSITLFACSKSKDVSDPPPASPTIIDIKPDSGSAGTDIEISGTNFSATASENIVKFNAFTATVKSSTTSLITATVPANASTGKVTVTVNDRTATSTSDFVVLTGSWLRKADYGGSARGNAKGFSIGGKGYIIGGYSSSGYEKDFWEYDPASDRWTKKADLPALGRERGVAFAIGDKGYFGLGYNFLEQEHKDFWEYDPAIDTWTRKADFPGTAREEAFAFELNNIGYVGSGTNDLYTAVYKDVWKFDPVTNVWTSSIPFPGNAVWGVTATSTTDKALLFFGNDQLGTVRGAWEFDLPSNSWIYFDNEPFPAKSAGIAFAIGQKVYTGFGLSLGTANSDLWELDPKEFKWNRKANCPAAGRSNLIAFSIGNHGYIGTGYSSEGKALKEFWEFTP